MLGIHFSGLAYDSEKSDKAFSKGDLGYILACKVWGQKSNDFIY